MKKNKWLLIPALTLLLFSTIGFIVTSFYDMEGAMALGKGMKIAIVRIWVICYNQVGQTQLLIPMFTALFVILESLYICNLKTTDSWTSRHNKWIKIFYIGFGIFWILLNIFLIYTFRTKDQGVGKGNYVQFSSSWEWIVGFRTLIFIVESLVFIKIIWFLRTKAVQKKLLFNQAYRIDAIKILAFAGVTYLFLFFLKSSTGRPFYMNLKDVYSKEVWQEMLDNGVLTEADREAFMQNVVNNTWGSSSYHEWWQINGNWFENLKYWNPFNKDWIGAPSGWKDRDFPSGHTLSTFVQFSMILFFIGKNKPPVSKKIKIISGIWLVHLLSMMFALVVARTHWFTDVFFTVMFAIPSLWIVSKTTDKICWNVINKRNNKVIKKIN